MNMTAASTRRSVTVSSPDSGHRQAVQTRQRCLFFYRGAPHCSDFLMQQANVLPVWLLSVWSVFTHPPWSGQTSDRSKTISPPLFLREGLTQLLLLLLG
jgi:hypothetical protein